MLRHPAPAGSEVFTPDLVALHLPLDVSETWLCNTDFQLAKGKLSAQSVLDSSSLAVRGAELTETHFAVQVAKDLATKSDAPFCETLVSRIDGGAKSLRFQSYVVDSLNLALASNEANVSLERLTLAKAANTASLQATYSLPADLKSWEASAAQF